MPPSRLPRRNHAMISTNSLTAPARWVATHPKETVSFATNYVLPVAGAAFTGSLISVLPLGPLEPLVVLLIRTFSQFRLRRNVAVTFFAMLRTMGLGDVQGQLLSLLSFLSLRSALGPSTAHMQSQFTNLVLGAGGHQAHLIAIILSILTGVTGCFGIGPAQLRSISINAIVGEVQSLAIFRGLGWLLDTIELSWRQFLGTARGAKYLRLLGYSKERAWNQAQRTSRIRRVSTTAKNMVAKAVFGYVQDDTRFPDTETLVDWVVGEKEEPSEDWEDWVLAGGDRETPRVESRGKSDPVIEVFEIDNTGDAAMTGSFLISAGGHFNLV